MSENVRAALPRFCRAEVGGGAESERVHSGRMRFFRRRAQVPPASPPPAPDETWDAARADQRREVERGRRVVEESRELVLVLDEDDRLIAASRRAREVFDQLVEGEPVPHEVLEADGGQAFSIEYDAAGRRERLLYLRSTGDLAAYEELRAGFTACGLARAPDAARATSSCPARERRAAGRRPAELIEQARVEVGQIGELIDDVLFLSELETGRQVVGLGSTLSPPDPRRRRRGLEERAARAGIDLEIEGDDDAELPAPAADDPRDRLRTWPGTRSATQAPAPR